MRSRAKRAGGERDHDQKRAERGELGDVAQGMDGKVNFGLLDHEEFIICSFYVLVNGDRSHLPLEWLRLAQNLGPRSFHDFSFQIFRICVILSGSAAR